mmetsp:Transcript_8474/g.26488  ORF Transcript_8474/g.26488 Transcript_8474/m.26488 type:complete len:224 (-) Transcript_8474:221-892(-)
MHDDVRAERQRLLQQRRHERVVHLHQRAVLLADAREASQVADALHGVRRRLDHDERDARRHGLLQPPRAVGAVHGDELDRHARVARRAREQPVRAAVRVVAQQHLVAVLAEPDDGGERRHARGVREAVLRALGVGDGVLQRGPRGIPRPRVIEVAELRRRRLLERRGDVDGHVGRAVRVRRGREPLHEPRLDRELGRRPVRVAPGGPALRRLAKRLRDVRRGG